MSLWSNLRGVMGSLLGIGGPAGVALKANAGAVEARNGADSAFAVMRGAAPVNDNDLVTKQYADTLASRTVVALQFDGNNALPVNSATEQFYVVTTTGPNATIGQLLWDDGLATGTTTVLAAATGRAIFTGAAFSGGTISLKATALYIWSGSAWQSDAAAVTGAVREIRYALNNSATQDSATIIPANASIVRATLNITTPYSGGTTIKVGVAGGTLNLVMDTTDNLATVSNQYAVYTDTPWGASAAAVRATIAGSPAAGVAALSVFYSVPDA